MNEETGVDYLRPCQIGETIHWLGVGVVVHSKDEQLHPGDYVTANFTWPWTNTFVMTAKELTQVNMSLVICVETGI